MQGSFVFVLLIITITMIGRVANTYMKQRERDPVNNKEVDEALARIRDLEERIVVLERIVTENKFDLRRQIDSL